MKGRAIVTMALMLFAGPMLAEDTVSDAPSQAEPVQACDSCSARKQSLQKISAARAEQEEPEEQAPEIQAHTSPDVDQAE